MKVLVTGGAGFIGSHLVDAYLARGDEVVIVDDLSSGKKENINKQAKFYKMDIQDTSLADIFQREKIELVNHHAAQLDVRKSVADPIFDARVNILGILNILENCRQFEVDKVIFSSSGGVIYGECENESAGESFPAGPLSPYGVSKLASEYYLYYYGKTFALNYTVLRYGNVYGPRQDPYGEAGVVAIFSEKMLENEELNIFGDGKQMRDYVYVGDIVKANMACMEKGNNEIFNIGTGQAISVNYLFKEMKEILNYEKDAVYKPARTGELFKSFLNITKAENLLHWKPQVNFSDGLKKTTAWFRKT
ncbi:NAD-dependent epimerase/dehydratase family protein [bacterium]|nr:NAD-dependent epimerase/dehydratase family protein [bacterium]